MAVTDSYDIYNWQIFYVTGDFRISFWAHKAEWTASVFENRIEQYTQASRELDIVTCVSQPCCSQSCRVRPAG